MIEALVIALDKSLLIWIGMGILLNKKYKWHAFVFYVVSTFVFTYYGFILLNHWIRPLSFIFAFLVSNLRKKGWISETKINFFYLSIVYMVIILGRTWVDFIIYTSDIINIGAHGYYTLSGTPDSFSSGLLLLLLSLFLKIVIFTISCLFVRSMLEKSGIANFIDRIDAEYRMLLSIGIGLILLCYYSVIFIPLVFGMTGSEMIQMQPIYMTLLTFIVAVLILLFSSIIKKEMILVRRSATLAHVNAQLAYKQQEILQKEILIKSLDKKIMDVGDVHKQLRSFNHGQSELLAAVFGAIESADKEVIYEILEQYGTKVQDVSKRELEFPDVSQLKTSQLMPIRFLLLSKADIAIKKSIKFTTEIPTEILEIGMPVLDFIDILGVWLNNAIEEAVQTEEKWVHTSFILDEDPEGVTLLEVRVTNGCRKETISLDMINEQGVTTKGEGRGSGLSIVEALLLKYENIYVTTRVTDETFMQLLEIVLDAPEEELRAENLELS